MDLSGLAYGYITVAGLAVITGLVLLLPFSVKKVEEELEAFLFLMGISAVAVSGKWSWELVRHALTEPFLISFAVLILGFGFRAVRAHIGKFVSFLISKFGLRLTVFFIVSGLGLVSSIITAIIAALVLSEIITALKLERKCEIKLTVCACFAIGLGAVLTPIGEPLSTIAVAALKGQPHNAGFDFLFHLLGKFVVPGVLAVALCAMLATAKADVGKRGLSEDKKESVKDISFRAGKVYLFVMALVFLGAGIMPVAEKIMPQLSSGLLYWLNSISAVLDNATLAAAEINPVLSDKQITYILMGLLVSGGMLIPGNIPNIISASKLGIKSREWAKYGLPMGGVLMLLYFVILNFALK